MQANYGYKDGSGDWFLTIDTDKCDACTKCVEACPEKALEMYVDDYDEEAAAVKEEKRKSIKYVCQPCGANRPCVNACAPGAITFSW